MDNTKQPATKQLAFGALIAALYVGLTYFIRVFSLADGAIQFRISEALTVLPVFNPAAIWGLTVGCFLANITSGVGYIDMVFGTLASLLAALFTYYFRRIRVFRLPLLSLLMPVLFNAVIVGAEIMIFFEKNVSLKAFSLNALWVGLGELGVIAVLGIPLFLTVEKNKKLHSLICQ